MPQTLSKHDYSKIFLDRVDMDQKKRHALELAETLKHVLDSTQTLQKNKMIEIINRVLTDLNNDEPEYADRVLNQLNGLYDKIEPKYPFQIQE